MLILCGLPFSGKSTFGMQVAVHLGIPFLDTDRLIEAKDLAVSGIGRSCREIYGAEGEFFFRRTESHVIVELIERWRNGEKAILALGGGCLLSDANAERLRESGCIVYLKTPLNRLLCRMLRQETVPAYLRGDPIAAFKLLARERSLHYEQTAHEVLDTTCMSDAAVVKELVRIAEKPFTAELSSHGE